VVSFVAMREGVFEREVGVVVRKMIGSAVAEESKMRTIRWHSSGLHHCRTKAWLQNWQFVLEPMPTCTRDDTLDTIAETL